MLSVIGMCALAFKGPGGLLCTIYSGHLDALCPQQQCHCIQRSCVDVQQRASSTEPVPQTHVTTTQMSFQRLSATLKKVARPIWKPWVWLQGLGSGGFLPGGLQGQPQSLVQPGLGRGGLPGLRQNSAPGQVPPSASHQSHAIHFGVAGTIPAQDVALALLAHS